MSDDLVLPPEARLDPRLGLYGGRYVIITCVICGREARHPLSWYRSRLMRGKEPKACSQACGAELRRRRAIA